MLICLIITRKDNRDTEVWDTWFCRAQHLTWSTRRQQRENLSGKWALNLTYRGVRIRVCGAVSSEQCVPQPRAQAQLTVQKGSSWPPVHLSSTQLFWLQTSTGWLLALFFFWFCHSDEMSVPCCVQRQELWRTKLNAVQGLSMGLSSLPPGDSGTHRQHLHVELPAHFSSRLRVLAVLLLSFCQQLEGYFIS